MDDIQNSLAKCLMVIMTFSGIQFSGLAKGHTFLCGVLLNMRI